MNPLVHDFAIESAHLPLAFSQQFYYTPTMTYAQFLVIFLILPIAGLTFLHYKDRTSPLPFSLKRWMQPWQAVVLTCLTALVWTTPWDNYLVSQAVWWYREDAVLATIGYVPVEEYSFFILQSILGSLLVFWLVKKLPLSTSTPPPWLVWGKSLCLTAVGLWAAWHLWFAQTQHLTYLSLILVWYVPAALVQALYGWQLQWKYGYSILASIFIQVTWLSAADALAIFLNIWTINPDLILGWYAGPLPFEEFFFFLCTSILVSIGPILFIEKLPKNTNHA